MKGCLWTFLLCEWRVSGKDGVMTEILQLTTLTKRWWNFCLDAAQLWFSKLHITFCILISHPVQSTFPVLTFWEIYWELHYKKMLFNVTLNISFVTLFRYDSLPLHQRKTSQWNKRLPDYTLFGTFQHNLLLRQHRGSHTMWSMKHSWHIL